MDFFRNLFGFDNDRQRPDPFFPPFPGEHESFFNFGNNDINRPPDGNHERNFYNFTDPMEMHHFFEQQMDNIFKSFGMPSFGTFFHALQHPDLNENLYEENKQDYRQQPREHFLKKGYDEPASIEEKVDKDVDGKLSITDLDSVLRGENSNQTGGPQENHSLTRYEEPKPFGGTIFDRMVQIKTTRKADGSSETQILKDIQGTQEITVTQRVGDKEYTFVKKRDKDGKEEIVETMINMNDDDKPFINSFFNETFFSKYFK